MILLGKMICFKKYNGGIMSNDILKESSKLIKEYLKEDLDSIYIERAVLGLFFSGVKLSTGYGGLCFTPIKEIPEAVCCPSSAKAMPLSGKLVNRKAIDYLRDLEHPNILRRTLGIATLNALSTMYWKENPPKDYKLEVGIDAFDEVKIPENGKTVVVGALAPILKKLIKADADFKVLEMDTRTLKEKELEHYASPKMASKYIPEADLVIITGTTLLNDTLPELLNYRKKDAQIIVTGPTASMIPEEFFRRGVTVLGGIIVTDPDKVLDIISEGGSGYHFFGKSAERLIIRNEL